MLVTRSLLALVAVFAMGATATGTLPPSVLSQRSLLSSAAKGPLALLGGPEGIAISLLLDTKPGQEAEAWIESEAEKAAQPALTFLKAEAKKHAKSEVQYFTELTQSFGKGHTGDIARRGLGPLALLGGPEGIAISLLLDTKPGQEAQAYVEKLAEKAGMDALAYLKKMAKSHGKSELQYFTELVQKVKSSAGKKASPAATRRSLLKSAAKGAVKTPLALLGGPEGIAISLLLDTTAGQEAQAYLEGLAEKAGMGVVDYLKQQAKKHGKGEVQYFTEITQKFA